MTLRALNPTRQQLRQTITVQVLVPAFLAKTPSALCSVAKIIVL